MRLQTMNIFHVADVISRAVFFFSFFHFGFLSFYAAEINDEDGKWKHLEMILFPKQKVSASAHSLSNAMFVVWHRIFT